MNEQRYAVVRDGVVENVVRWDGESEWAPPAGTILVQSDEAGPGDAYDGKVITRPAASEPDEPEKTPLAQLREALLADPNLAPATKEAIQQIAGGAAVDAKPVPMTKV